MRSSFQRAGQKVTSYTFFTTENAKAARELVTILKEAKADVPAQLQEMVQYGGGGGGRGESDLIELASLFLSDAFFAGRYGGGGRGRGGGGGGRGGFGGGGYGGGGGGGDSGWGGRGGGDRW